MSRLLWLPLADSWWFIFIFIFIFLQWQKAARGRGSSAPSYWLLVISIRHPQWRNDHVSSSSMSCNITIVYSFNNRHLFFPLFIFWFSSCHLGPCFAPMMQPWPKPWSAATCWDTNVSNKKIFFMLALFHLLSFLPLCFLFFVCKTVWFDHFTHWFLLIAGTCHCQQFPWTDVYC